MALSPVLSIATSGLRASSLRATSAANNIVNINTPDYEATRVAQNTIRSGPNLSSGSALEAQLIGTEKGPNLGEEILQLIEVETTYRANAEVLRTASELSRDLLDTLA